MNEYEFEALPELEDEYEDEESLGMLARGRGGQLDGQGQGEFEFEDEFEWEGEWEGEYEGEYESEEFFRQIAALAQRAAQSPTLRRTGLAAARAGLRGLGGLGGALGGALGPQGAAIGRDLGRLAGRHLGAMLPAREYEGEDEWEYEAEVNPQLRAYSPNALMEHLGHAAAQTESEAEAEAFIGALIPLAARIIPRAAPAIMRATPQLVRGLANVTRTLRRNPSTRPLVRTLPTVVRQTAATLARQQAQGRPATPQRAVRTLAQQTARVIGSPRQCTRAYRQSRALDHQFHRVARGAQREW